MLSGLSIFDVGNFEDQNQGEPISWFPSQYHPRIKDHLTTPDE
jgi:hypothetical protein